MLSHNSCVARWWHSWPVASHRSICSLLRSVGSLPAARSTHSCGAGQFQRRVVQMNQSPLPFSVIVARCYPRRTRTRAQVGPDDAHAVPLAAVGAPPRCSNGVKCSALGSSTPRATVPAGYGQCPDRPTDRPGTAGRLHCTRRGRSHTRATSRPTAKLNAYISGASACNGIVPSVQRRAGPVSASCARQRRLVVRDSRWCPELFGPRRWSSSWTPPVCTRAVCELAFCPRHLAIASESTAQ